MLADVAKAGGAEQGIGEGVKDDVGIAVAGEAAVMGQLDSAEHDRPVSGEGVDVEADASTWGKAAGEPLFGPLEIRWKRELLQRRIARDGGDLHAGSTHDRRLVGRGRTAPSLIGRIEGRQAKGLRRWLSGEHRAIDWLSERFVDPGQGVADRKYWRRAFEELKRCKQPVDHCRRAEGAGRIVDQHRVAVDRGEPGTDRIRACRASGDEVADLEALERLRSTRLLSVGDHDPRRLHGGMTDQRLHRPPQHRLAAQQSELLGHGAVRAFALAGGDDQGGSGHWRAPCPSTGGPVKPRLPMDLLKPIHVGPVRIDAPVILAPMTGVTDLPFRRAVKRYGAGLTVSELIASEAMIRETRQSLQKSLWDPAEEPVSLQLAGCEPQVMAEAAKLTEQRGAAIIDINMGCPVRKVVNGDAGSALMRDLPLAASLIEATHKAVSVPVRLKMRVGSDP